LVCVWQQHGNLSFNPLILLLFALRLRSDKLETFLLLASGAHASM